MKQIKQERLQKIVVEKLKEAMVCEDDAKIVADVLIEADASGVFSHGSIRLEHYINRIKQGGINLAAALPVIQGKYPWAKTLDAKGALGHVAGVKAMNEGIKTAEELGIAVVSVKNSSHCGALAYYARRIAEQGFIGAVMTNTDKCVVPTNGKERFFGTNPMAWGFPQSDNTAPVIVDMATSAGALGKILAAKQKGEKIPANWCVDKEGKPTDDPNKMASLLPMSGHKGYAIAFLIETMTAILTSSPFGPHVLPMYDKMNELRDLSMFFLIMATDLYQPADRFRQNLGQMIGELHEQPTTPGVERVLVPGEPERLKREESARSGVPILDSVAEFLGLQEADYEI